ncbi:MAG TPA: hypothetical protein VLE93_01855 [Candidatus Saccharimonadales bacterium]|nr:hypothetical protein [Candidatus Saccharimonadales bacterium]
MERKILIIVFEPDLLVPGLAARSTVREEGRYILIIADHDCYQEYLDQVEAVEIYSPASLTNHKPMKVYRDVQMRSLNCVCFHPPVGRAESYPIIRLKSILREMGLKLPSLQAA